MNHGLETFIGTVFKYYCFPVLSENHGLGKQRDDVDRKSYGYVAYNCARGTLFENALYGDKSIQLLNLLGSLKCG